MKRFFIYTLLCVILPLGAQAQVFDEWFEDQTLRIDYIMGGNAQHQEIYLHGLSRQPMWAGRKARLADSPLKGNGQLTVRDHVSHQVLYVWTFSTLFQEWLLEDEAKHICRSFETSYNIPFPKQKVDVTVALTDNRQQVISELTHTVDPKDILIRTLVPNGIPFHYIWKGGKAALTPKQSTHSRRYIPTPFNPLEGVDITGCVDLAIVAEGYTEEQMGKFYADCQRAVDALFEREPFASLKDRFNVVAVAAPSRNSGPSVPHEGIWSHTALQSHYDTFYSQRYLTTSSMHRLYDVLSGVPLEHVLVLVNTDTYGGGGIYNQLLCSSSDHPTFKQVFVHEFGHSYAGLGDEYAYDDMDTVWYPADVEPWEPNITTLHDFSSKWEDMMPAGTPIPTPLDPKVPDIRTVSLQDKEAMKRLNDCVGVIGVFEGAGYQTKGCYRPAQECRMKVNEVDDFCPVCSRAIRRITDFYTAQ